jgi:hypothetical protein
MFGQTTFGKGLDLTSFPFQIVSCFLSCFCFFFISNGVSNLKRQVPFQFIPKGLEQKYRFIDQVRQSFFPRNPIFFKKEGKPFPSGPSSEPNPDRQSITQKT